MTATWEPADADDPSFDVVTSTAHNSLSSRSAAGAHPASAVTFDPTASGLAADTVQDAIDEVAAGGGGGAVDSVNGQTGVVVLDAGDVDALPVSAVGLLPGETNRGTWDVAETYAVGDVVAVSETLYVASAASTGLDPASNPGSWDEIGDFSHRRIELGPGSSAAGVAATAIGSSSATGDGSTAIGISSSAAGDGSTAIGVSSSAAGVGSTAIGVNSSATGDGDINIGDVFKGRVDDPLGARTPDAASIETGFVDLPETAVVTNPAADHQRLIARTDGLYVRDETGTEVGPLGTTEWSGITGKPSTFAPSAHAASHALLGADALQLDGSQITTGAVAPGRLPRITPTVYTGSSGPWAATAEGAATGNGGLNVAYRMAYLPILLTARPWDRCGVTTTVAGAGTSWEVGIYDLLANGEPGAQVASFGTLDMSVTAGDQDLTISFTPSSTRWFWLGIKVTAFGSAPTVRVAGATGPAPRLPGWPHRRNGDTFAGLIVTTGLTAGPLPAVAPTVGNVLGQATYSPSLPIVYMRPA